MLEICFYALLVPSRPISSSRHRLTPTVAPARASRTHVRGNLPALEESLRPLTLLTSVWPATRFLPRHINIKLDHASYRRAQPRPRSSRTCPISRACTLNFDPARQPNRIQPARLDCSAPLRCFCWLESEHCIGTGSSCDRVHHCTSPQKQRDRLRPTPRVSKRKLITPLLQLQLTASPLALDAQPRLVQDGERKVSPKEVQEHVTEDSAWVVLDGVVFE